MQIDEEALSAAVQVGGMPRVHTKRIIQAYLGALPNKHTEDKAADRIRRKCEMRQIELKRTQNTEDDKPIMAYHPMWKHLYDK